jgi:2-succinyl-5-enolpyruvyl-6-hydroxy-3-cyclohexene-1-carboxylate synthase
VLLTGDLSFLHDANGLLLAPRFRGSLTVVVINNRGGGIFEHLPIAQVAGAFEEFFATPQAVDLGRLVAAHGIAHAQVADWGALVARVASPEPGVRILEVSTDRKQDAAQRKHWFAELAAGLGSP